MQLFRKSSLRLNLLDLHLICANSLMKETASYWDWGLDSADLGSSPVWDLENGFGGNGEQTQGTMALYDGTCVRRGPFANTTRHWISKANGHGFDILANPHCLSRGFEIGQQKTRFEDRITPDAINEVLKQSTYMEFLNRLEVKAHNSIPQFVRGDFFALTAPNGN
jgi:tyrosinase